MGYSLTQPKLARFLIVCAIYGMTFGSEMPSMGLQHGRQCCTTARHSSAMKWSSHTQKQISAKVYGRSTG